MASYDIGKDVVVKWIREHFDSNARILDVGACDGKWRKLLPEYKMDAVEIWKPNCDRIKPLYDNVYCKNIADFCYNYFDLIIFGDVIEHMTVQQAQAVLSYAYDRCSDMIVAVPFLYEQGKIYGNPWEEHKQPDLTAEVFAERYHGFEVLHDTGKNYCFYHKERMVV